MCGIIGYKGKKHPKENNKKCWKNFSSRRKIK